MNNKGFIETIALGGLALALMGWAVWSYDNNKNEPIALGGGASVWIPSNSYVKLFDATYGVQVQSLASCDTIDTDADGKFVCGTDGGGGGGGSGTVSTSTPLVDTYVTYATGADTIGNESAFTYDDATDKLVVVNASTTNLSVSGYFDFLGTTITNVSTWFNGLFNTQLATKDTDDLGEGSTNLYNQTHTGEVTGAVATVIAPGVVDSDNITNDSILEVDLDVTNSPTDNYVLSYDSGTSGFTWAVDATGSGGNGLATSTPIADTEIIFGTSINDVGSESAFTYNDATNLFTVPNATTTLISGATAWFTNFIGSLTGNADTATSLAGNGTNASAGNAILGVDASGNAEGAFDVWTEAENTSAGYTTNTGTVTSVAQTVPNFLSVSGSPVTTSGTLAITLSGTALPVLNGGTGITSFGTGVATWLGTPSSANFASAVTGETGTGALVFGTSPTLVTPALGTPASGVLTNTTGLPLTTGVTGTLPIANGGTNLTTYTTGDILYASASNVLSKLAAGSDGEVLKLASGVPSWGNDITGGGGGSGAFATTTDSGIEVIYPAVSASDFTLGGSGATSTSKFHFDESATSLRLGTGTVVNSFSGTGDSYINSGFNFGIGTTSPYAKLSVVGEVVADNFTATSTTATSSIRGGLNVGSGGLVYDFSSGNVGVGTSAPTEAVTVDGRVLVTGAAAGLILDPRDGSGSGYQWYNPTGDDLRLNNGTDVLTITNAGNLGLGTTSPYAKLSVNGNAVVDGNIYTSYITATSTSATSTLPNLAATNFSLTGGLFDSAASAGTNGYVLQSTGSATQWVATSSLGISGGGGGSGTVNTGTSGFFTYYPSTGTTVDDQTVLNLSGSNIGVGTSSPYATLSVSGNTAITENLIAYDDVWFGAASTSTAPFWWDVSESTAYIGNGGAGDSVVQFGEDDNSWIIGYDDTDKTFRIASSTVLGTNDVFTIEKGGEIGIGTIAPSYQLHVNIATDGDVAGFTDANGTCTIDPTSTSLLCSSDRTLKKDISSLDPTEVLNKVLSLNPVNYRWLNQSSSDSEQIGFIAQEIEEIFPEFVTVGPEDKKAVAYGALTPILASAIQAINLDITSTSTVFENGELTLMGRILEYFESLGVKFSDGIASITNLVAERATVGTSEKPTGITLYDEVTGEAYCFSIKNGAPVSTLGACDTTTSTPETVIDDEESTEEETGGEGGSNDTRE